MDWPDLISMLIGSGLTLGFSFLFNSIFDKVKYKREIRDIFIKKRIEGYEQIEEVIGAISLVMQDEDKSRYHSFFVILGIYQQLTMHLAIALKFSVWYSSTVSKLLSELNKIQLLVVDSEDYNFEENHPDYQKKITLGKAMYETIWDIKTDLTKQIADDYMKMYKTDYRKILKDKIRERTF
jgi:hypothetical protein